MTVSWGLGIEAQPQLSLRQARKCPSTQVCFTCRVLKVPDSLIPSSPLDEEHVPKASSAPCSVTSSWKDVESGWHDLLLKGHIVAVGSPEDAVTYIVPFDDMAFGILSHPGGVGKSAGSQTPSQTLGAG